MKRGSFGLTSVLLLSWMVVVLAGCQSMNMPKLPSLAFWNKDAPVLSARHEGYIEPPAERLEPTPSGLAKSGNNAGPPPTRPPFASSNKDADDSVAASGSGDRYKIMDDEPSEGPSEIEKAVAKLNQPATGNRYSNSSSVSADSGMTRPSSGGRFTSNTGGGNSLADEAKKLVNSVSSDSSIQLDMNNTPNLDIQQNGGSFQPGNTFGQKPKQEEIGPPQKITNPYSNGGSSIANASGGSGFRASTPERAENFAAGGNGYPVTPYQGFTQRQVNHEADATDQRMRSGANSPSTSPLEPSPLMRVEQRPAPNTQSSAAAKVAKLPASLKNQSGGFAPGSIGKSRGTVMRSSAEFEAAIMGNSPATAATEGSGTRSSENPDSSMKINNGGSFRQ